MWLVFADELRSSRIISRSRARSDKVVGKGGHGRQGGRGRHDGQVIRPEAESLEPFALRRQSLAHPAVVSRERVANAVVKAVLASLPEFDFGRREAITAPGAWPFERLIARSSRDRGEFVLEDLSPWNDLTLVRHDGTELTASGSTLKVLIGFGIGGPFDPPLNPDLTFEYVPEKCKRRVRVSGELVALATRAVGVEHEAALIEPFEQDDATIGSTIDVHRAQRHRVGLQHPSCVCLSEPRAKLLERIGVRVSVAQDARHVFAPKSGQPIGHVSILTQSAARPSRAYQPCTAEDSKDAEGNA